MTSAQVTDLFFDRLPTMCGGPNLLFTLTDCRTRGVGTPHRMLGETPNQRVVHDSRTG
jgi:hypothetical protein